MTKHLAFSALGLAAFTLIACETEQPVPPAPITQACLADQLSDFVGQDQSALDALDPQIASGLRILQADGIVDASYNPDRTNVTIGTDGAIESIRCF